MLDEHERNTLMTMLDSMVDEPARETREALAQTTLRLLGISDYTASLAFMNQQSKRPDALPNKKHLSWIDDEDRLVKVGNSRKPAKIDGGPAFWVRYTPLQEARKAMQAMALADKEFNQELLKKANPHLDSAIEVSIAALQTIGIVRPDAKRRGHYHIAQQKDIDKWIEEIRELKAHPEYLKYQPEKQKPKS